MSVELIAIVQAAHERHRFVELEGGASADDLLAALDLPDHEPYMTLINGLSVAPGRRSATRLAEGDKVIVFPPLKGG